jgi:hypothetical protein
LSIGTGCNESEVSNSVEISSRVRVVVINFKLSMSAQTRKPYAIRSLDEAVGVYLSNLRIFVRRARESLVELEAVATEVKQKWPLPLGETVKDPSQYPEVEKLTFKRDFLSDSVLIFSVMAVESFLNYYGVVRFGEPEYKRNFERLGLVPKLSCSVALL